MKNVSALFFDTALLSDGWASGVRVQITDGVISQVQRDAAPAAGDERAAIGLPGMPNLHSHAFQRGMAGLAEQRSIGKDTFWSWRELMYRFAGRITPDDLEVIAAQAFVEMLESGFTRVGEFHYLHHDLDGKRFKDPAEMSTRIAAAADSTGINLTLLPVFYAHGGFGGQPPASAQARFVTDVAEYARLIESTRSAVARLKHAVVGIAPHSLRAVTREDLTAILPCAASAPVHIHVAEQLREVEECEAWSGQRPVEWLLNAAPVDSRWCLVHATHMNDLEVVRLARSGAVAGLCPITEANLGDGLFRAPEYQAAGGAFGIGTDSNVRIDMAEELRWLEYGQRLKERARNLMATSQAASTGRALFDAAVSGGAQALGVQAGIAVGAPADLVSLDQRHVAFSARSGDALLDALIFGGASGAIDSVWCAGRKVVASGAHLHREAVAARFRTTLARLIAA